MKYVLAYGLVVLLGRFCFKLGAVLVAIPVVGCLARAPERLRGVVAGILSGLGGVAAAVAFGYYIFRLLIGSNAFGPLPLLTATLPLVITIGNDLALAGQLFVSLTKFIQLGHVPEGTEGMAVGVRFKAIGAILGVVLTLLWFFFVHEG
jgi:hypothetical protein